MTRPTISIAVVLLSLAIASMVIVTTQKKIPSGWAVFTSKKLHYSITYPASWNINTAEESTGRIQMTSAPLNQNGVGPLDYRFISSDSSFVIDATEVNPDRLDPKTWFEKVLAPNVSPPLTQESTTVNGLPAYSLVTDEMGTLRHVYVFSGQRIISIYYSTEQKEFAATYTTMLQSLKMN